MNALRSRFGDEEALRRMARAGFDAADYTFNEMVHPECVWNSTGWQEYARQILDVAHAVGLHFNQAHAPFLFDWDTKWQTPAFELEILPVIKHSIECAAFLGAKYIVVHPIHHIRYRGSEKQLWEWNRAYYATLLPVARQCGIHIALENMWQTDPLRGCGDSDVFSHPEEFRDFLDCLQDDYAAACVDVGHAGLAGEDPAVMLRVLGPRVKALHIHDNRHHVDDHTLPYVGLLDWDAITTALADIGYEGDFTFEVTNFVTPFDDELVDAALAFQVAVGRRLAQKSTARTSNASSYHNAAR